MMYRVIPSGAVRELRSDHGQTQMAFAIYCGLSVSSITHYENGSRIPDYRVTLMLYRLACNVGRQDLASFFLQMINAGMVAHAVVPVRSDDELIKLRAVQAILYDPVYARLRKELEKLLAPVEHDLAPMEKHLREVGAFAHHGHSGGKATRKEKGKRVK